MTAAPTSVPNAAAPLHVAALHVYPVKSLGGVAVDAARVDDLGLALDRRWMLVDGDGRALTQREHAGLARLRVTLVGDGTVRVTASDGAAIDLAPSAPGAARRRVLLFDDVLEGATYPPAVDAWFAERTGLACALVHLPDDVVRPVDPAYAEPGDRAAFSDGYPVLVATQASLAALNARLVARGEPAVSMARFRPNVVVAGDGAPFAEDAWPGLAVGEVVLRLAKPCARCVVTTIDQATGARGVEPLRTLAEFRRRAGKVLFAQNALVRRGGTVRVGDPVHVLDRADRADRPALGGDAERSTTADRGGVR